MAFSAHWLVALTTKIQCGGRLVVSKEGNYKLCCQDMINCDDRIHIPNFNFSVLCLG